MNKTHSFFLNIILPSVTSLILVFVSLFVFFIPAFESAILERKKEMITELARTAESVCQKYSLLIKNDSLNIKVAKKMASNEIEKLRYGALRKDYFWISDTMPNMIMHPYNKELVGKSLTDFTDKQGTKIFTEFAEFVKSNNSGFYTYYWQWKDDSSKIVPKLSYLCYFEEWAWIIGTGVYLDDINIEISILEKKIIKVSLFILILVLLLILFSIRNSRQIDLERIKAAKLSKISLENKLDKSRNQYKELLAEKAYEREALLEEFQISMLSNSRYLSEIKHKAILKLDSKISIKDACIKLSSTENNAFLVCTGNNEPIGIVTDTDIRKRVVSSGIDSKLPISNIMTSPLFTINDTALIFQAQIKMQKENINHLAIKNKLNNITAIISSKELLSFQEDTSSFLISKISNSLDIMELKEYLSQLPNLVKSLIDCNVNANNITKIITSISDAIINSCSNIIFKEIGEAPSEFAFIVLGSSARLEQTLSTDQDNALIYIETPINMEKTKEYYALFSNKICDYLDTIGYPFCKGGVMAKNPLRCVSLSQWEKYFKSWIFDGNPKDLLDASIYFDFRCVLGSKDLVLRLAESLKKLSKNQNPFFSKMAENALLFSPPINVLGNIILGSKGEPDNTFCIKTAIRPLIDIARIYSIKGGILDLGTLKRFQILSSISIISKKDYDEIVETYNFLMSLRLKNQSAFYLKDVEINNFIDWDSLTNFDKTMVKKSLSIIQDLQSRLKYDFLGSI